MQYKFLIACIIGTILEWYDFSIFGVLSPVLAKVFFPTSDHLASLLYTYCIFFCSFLIRPLGAVMFGHLGDTMGRRPIIIVSIVMMAIPTTLMGCLPSYKTVGLFSPVLL